MIRLPFRSRYLRRAHLNCPGSGTPIDAPCLIREGKAACPVCGHWKEVIYRPGAVIPGHDKEAA